jgi:GNAT superfamily N-acetyltransferase
VVAPPRLRREHSGVPTLPTGCALRRATAADLAAYGELCRRTFEETYRDHHDEDALARHVAATFRDERLRDELADPERLVLAVTCDAAWVAYALLERGPSPSTVRGDRPREIVRFYVASSWQGRGVAAPLMAAALDAARAAGCDVAWLTVWEQNSRALRFYARQGFVPVGRTTYLFDGTPENDLLLAVAL